MWPLDASKVLPCIGSQIHTGLAPDAVTFSTRAGRCSRTLPAPILVMKVSRPGSRSGSSRSIRVSASSTVVVGPSFTPIGLRIFEANSMCAPSSWRVRSPIQTMCPETSYRSPVRESTRVSAVS